MSLSIEEIKKQYSITSSQLWEIEGALDIGIASTGKSKKQSILQVWEKLEIKENEILKKIFLKYGGFILYYLVEDKFISGNMIGANGLILGADAMINGPNSKQLIGVNYEGILWDHRTPEGIVVELEKTLILEYSIYGVFTLLKKEIDSNDLGLYLYIYPDVLKKIEIDINEYYLKFFQYGGLFLWQTFFIDKPTDILTPYFQGSLQYQFEYIFGEKIQSKLGVIEASDFDEVYQIMQKKEYKTRLEKLVVLLKENKKIGEVEIQINKGVSDAAIFKIENKIKSKIPNGIKAFYKTINGFNLKWKTNKQAKVEAECLLEFLSLEQMFGGYNEEEWVYNLDWNFNLFKLNNWNDQDVEINSELLNYKKYKVIAIHEDYAILIDFNSNSEKVSIIKKWDHSILDISFEEYIDLLFKVKGIKNWEFHIKALREKNKEDGQSEVHLKLESLFPEVT